MYDIFIFDNEVNEENTTIKGLDKLAQVKSLKIFVNVFDANKPKMVLDFQDFTIENSLEVLELQNFRVENLSDISLLPYLRKFRCIDCDGLEPIMIPDDVEFETD